MLTGVTRETSKEPVRIGDFVFDRSTGEISPVETDGELKRTRLPPQPARLLELLVDRPGELVSREEIRDELWPDSYVDFDQGLNFCVRQIRSALGDSAADSSYVETLPRRGYRLLQPVQPCATPEKGPEPSPPARPAGQLPKWALGGAVVLFLALAVARFGLAPDPGSTVRLAIMPFELSAVGDEAGELARLSEWLLAELSGESENGLEVLGPRSTARFADTPFPALDRLTEELAADFVLNARYFEREGKREFIIELIRLDDGSHPWAQLYDTRQQSWQAIAEDALENAYRELGSAP